MSLPVPTGVPSHLGVLFDRMYSVYSRDPRPVNAIRWSVDPGVGSAYMTIAGATVALVMTKVDTTNRQLEYNIADQSGSIPTLNDFKTWLNSSLTSFFPSGVSVTWDSGFDDHYDSALRLLEGFYDSTLQVATSINYLQMRVMALVFDQLASDTANMFSHLSVGGAEGMWLEWIGDFYGVRKMTDEDPEGYRRRVLRSLAQPKENNVAIANLVSQSFGVADVLALDSTLFHCILYVFGSLAQPTLVMPYVRSVAPAGIVWTGIEIPPGGELTGAIAGHTRAGTTPPLSGVFAILR